VKPPTPSEAGEALLDADAAAVAAVKPWQDSRAIDALGRIASLGDQPPLRALCGAVIAAGALGRDKRLFRAGLRMLAAHTLATLAKDFVKKRVDRTRPRSMDAPGKDHRPAPGRDEAKEETSFPSGHSAGAAAVGRALARDFPAAALPAYGAAGFLALAQIPRCAHYPTDVGVGVAIGVAAEAAVSFGFRAAGLEPD
jgi:membrane-associated phospholipid phosphatase